MYKIAVSARIEGTRSPKVHIGTLETPIEEIEVNVEDTKSLLRLAAGKKLGDVEVVEIIVMCR